MTPRTPQLPPHDSLTVIEDRWFHVGRPWSDQPGLIYAGSEDPHAGTYVLDCRDWADETSFGNVQSVDVAALADGIVRDHNDALAARSLPSLDLERLCYAVDAVIASGRLIDGRPTQLARTLAAAYAAADATR